MKSLKTRTRSGKLVVPSWFASPLGVFHWLRTTVRSSNPTLPSSERSVAQPSPLDCARAGAEQSAIHAAQRSLKCRLVLMVIPHEWFLADSVRFRIREDLAVQSLERWSSALFFLVYALYRPQWPILPPSLKRLWLAPEKPLRRPEASSLRRQSPMSLAHLTMLVHPTRRTSSGSLELG